jgi:hypothetical protein
VPFSLYLPAVTDQRFPPIGRRDLRALILVAGPKDLDAYELPRFDTVRAVTVVRDTLKEIPSDVLAHLDGAVGPPTLDALCDRITRERYTLLHVVGHARYRAESSATTLYLSRPDGTVDPVEGQRLLDRLGALGGAQGLPHFAFLSCCEGASPEAEDALGGLGQRLVRDLGMPAVVAMTAPITVKTAFDLASGFYAGLRAHGELDRALVEATAPLAERADIRVPVSALFSRLGGRPLFSDVTDRDLTPAETADGLERVERLLQERAPSLLLAFRGHAVSVEGTLNAAPDKWNKALLDERDAALRKINELCGEALELSFRALALGQAPPPYNANCPFRGLNPFRREDRPFFFGREKLVADLAPRLTEDPFFLAVLGPSGSGKSSLVLAGLVPALLERLSGLNPVEITPGTDPVTQLDIALNQDPGLLVVDQFEELFTLCTDPAKRREFLDRMLGLVGSRRIVLTMRVDFLGECAPDEALRQLMEKHQRLVPPMNREELRGSMERQASAVGLKFEENLIERILDDVAGEPGAMPLLQHTLLELWNRRNGRWLRARAYGDIGGVRGAIARTADTFFGKLDPAEQRRVRDIFLRLTRLGDNPDPGEERRDTRRRVALSDLVPDGSDLETTKALVARLAGTRLIVTGVRKVAQPGGAVRDQEEVEVAHEALIRHWPRLRDWLDDNDEALRLRAGVGDAAREWDRGGRDADLLVHRGKRLDAIAAIGQTSGLALNVLETAYYENCLALRARERRKTRSPSPTQRHSAPSIGIGSFRIYLDASSLIAYLIVFLAFLSSVGIVTFQLPRISEWWQRDTTKGTPVTAPSVPKPEHPTKNPSESTRTTTTNDPPLIYSEVEGPARDSTVPAPAAGPSRDEVTLVNMIPVSLSGEHEQDSEPCLAVNPADPRQMAASVLNATPAGRLPTPIFVSSDGGNTWRLNNIVPGVPGGSTIGNMTLCFATSGNSLYAAAVQVSGTQLVLNVLRTGTFLDSALMSVLNQRRNVDNPFILAVSNQGKDRVYVGINDFQARPAPRTATVDVCDDAGSAGARFTPARIEVRNTDRQDGSRIRPVAHPEGTVYAAYYGWRSIVGEFASGMLDITTDVVVVRDDQGATVEPRFEDLIDRDDQLYGQRVVQGVKVLFQQSGLPQGGQQRINGTLSLAVDPRPGNSGTIYLAWGDREGGYAFVLHVRGSTDRGANWSPDDLLTVRSATNAALAVNSEGTIGLLYQRLIGTDSSRRWVTHFRKSQDGKTWTDLVLAQTPANTPAKEFDPYLGGYDFLLAVGKDFYGIFSANNTPDPSSFPSGVRFQRNHDLNAKRLLDRDNATAVPISIDPFFFQIKVQ